MDAIHLILGQNGHTTRSEAMPQATSGGVAAAFLRALAALEGQHASATTSAVEAPKDGVAAEEDAPTVGDERSPEDVAVVAHDEAEDVPADEPENELTVPPRSVEEEALPLTWGETPAKAISDVPEGEAATAPVARAAIFTAPAPHQSAQTVALHQSPQQGPPDSLDTAVVEAPVLLGTLGNAAAPPEVSRYTAGALPFMSRLGGPVPGENAQYISAENRELLAAMDREATIEPEVGPPEGETQEVLPTLKAVPPDRSAQQMPPGIAPDAIGPFAVEAKAEDGGLRTLIEGISSLPLDTTAPPSRAGITATTIPHASEARPILQSIAEASVRAQDGTIELRLSPEELGRVRISMSHTDLGIAVVLNVERDDTLALLRRHASELAAALRDAGLGQATIEFAQRDQGGSQDSQRRAAAQAFATLSDTGVEATRPALRLSGDGALDIRM